MPQLLTSATNVNCQASRVESLKNALHSLISVCKRMSLKQWGKIIFQGEFTFCSNLQFQKICTKNSTANISAVKITVFRRIPFPAVLPLYYLHLITAPSTVEKCKHRFTVVYYKIYTFTW